MYRSACGWMYILCQFVDSVMVNLWWGIYICQSVDGCLGPFDDGQCVDECIGQCVDRCIGQCVDECIGLCADERIDQCVDKRLGQCVGECKGQCVDEHLGQCVDECIGQCNLWMSVHAGKTIGTCIR